MATPRMSRETVELVMRSKVSVSALKESDIKQRGNYLAIMVGGKLVGLHQVIAIQKYGERCVNMCASFRQHPHQGGTYDFDNVIIDDNLACTRNRVVSKPKTRCKVKATKGGHEMIFNSQAEVARCFNVHPKSVFDACNGLFKLEGYTLERVVA